MAALSAPEMLGGAACATRSTDDRKRRPRKPPRPCRTEALDTGRFPIQI
jgi:hypothetical protein